MANNERLAQLGTRRKKLISDLAAVERELAELIPVTASEGMRQVDIVNATGYTRESVRQMCLTAAEREDLNARRRKARAGSTS